MQTLTHSQTGQTAGQMADYSTARCMHTCGSHCAPDPDGSLASPGLKDYRNGPKRWPINTTVLDSPACSVPEFADYPTRLFLVTGSSVQVAADTIEEMLDKGKSWAHEGSRIVRVPVVPYYEKKESGSGRTVGSSPIAGGGWGGECGATLWVQADKFADVIEARRMLRALGGPASYIQDNPGSGYDVSTLQAWWVNGLVDNKDGLDGFWLQCEQKRKGHNELCSALDIEWDWRRYSPYTDEGHDTQLTLL